LALLCEHDPVLLARVREWAKPPAGRDPTAGLMHESLEAVTSGRVDGVPEEVVREMTECRRLANEKVLDQLLAGRTIDEALTAVRLEDRAAFLNPALLKLGDAACVRELDRFPTGELVLKELQDRPPGVDGFGLHFAPTGPGEAHAFGGITFGNRVDGSALPEKLQGVTFTPNQGNPSRGTLLFRFAGGEELAFEAAAEDFSAAHRMVTGDYPMGQRWAPGEAIRLAGLQGDGLYRHFGPTAVRLLPRYRVSLHPALADTDLGYAAVISQLLPTSGRDVILRGADKNIGPAVARRLEQDIDRWLRVLAPNEGPPPVYALTDVPVKLTVKDKRIVLSCDVAADPRKRGLPDQLLGAAFIELHAITRPKENDDQRRYDIEFAQEFFRQVPLLTAASHDLFRVNQFAQVLALVRWAARHPGVIFTGVPPIPQGVIRTPSFLAMTSAAKGKWPSEEVITPVLGLQGKGELTDRLKRINLRIDSLESENDWIADLVANMTAERLATFDTEAKATFREADEERLVAAAVAPLAKELDQQRRDVLRYWFQLRCRKIQTTSRVLTSE
jgi:hypothetical protein